MSISAKSAASTPPAPARIVTTAERTSYSPDSRVRTSSSPTSFFSLARSRSASSRVAWSDSSVPISTSVSRSSMRASMVTMRSRSEPARLRCARDLLRLVGVVPQVGRGGLLLEVVDRPREHVEVGDPAHGVHRRAQFLDLLREVNSHVATAYGSAEVAAVWTGALAVRARRGGPGFLAARRVLERGGRDRGVRSLGRGSPVEWPRRPTGHRGGAQVSPGHSTDAEPVEWPRRRPRPGSSHCARPAT